MPTLLLLLLLGAQLVTLGMVAWLVRRLTWFETVVSLRLPVPPRAAPRPPGPTTTSAGCPHPVRSRVDASVLGRPQFFCLACDATVPLPKE